MSLPRISVVTPSYNQGHFLEQTLDSVLTQGYPNLEFIVMDGGSTDQSTSLLKKYEKHLMYWVSEPDRGQSHAINKGFARATGEVMTWLCSDDYFLPDALHKVANHFQQNPKADVIHGGCIMLEGEEELEENFGAGTQLPEDYFLFMAFPQPAAFFRRSLLEKVGKVDESLHFGMDYDLFLRMKLLGEFLPVKDVFSVYRLHEGSKTVSSQEKFKTEYLQIFSRFLRTFLRHEEIGLLKSLGDYHESPLNYLHLTKSSSLSEDFIRSVFTRWLQHQMTLAFGERQFSRVVNLGKTYQNYASEAWKADENSQKLFASARYEIASPAQKLSLRLRKTFS